MSKNIIITGANGALGTAVVKKFLAGGYQVIAVDRSGKVPDYAKENKLYSAHKVNLADEKEVSNFAQQAIQQFGKIDGVLMLAGGFAMGNINDTDGNAFKKNAGYKF